MSDREGSNARHRLTDQQQRVLDGVGDGLRNKDIAVLIGVSEGAVKATVQQLFRKTSTRKRVQLVLIALEGSGPGLRADTTTVAENNVLTHRRFFAAVFPYTTDVRRFLVCTLALSIVVFSATVEIVASSLASGVPAQDSSRKKYTAQMRVTTRSFWSSVQPETGRAPKAFIRAARSRSRSRPSNTGSSWRLASRPFGRVRAPRCRSTSCSRSRGGSLPGSSS